MANQETERCTGSRREREHAAMLDAALARPGVREVMDVYHGWQEKDRGLDAYRSGHEGTWSRHEFELLQLSLNPAGQEALECRSGVRFLPSWPTDNHRTSAAFAVVTPHGSPEKTRGSPFCGCGFGCLRRRRE